MFTTLHSLADSILEKVLEEVKVEQQRDTQSKTAQKLDNSNTYVAKERSQIFSSIRSVKPKVGSLLAVGLGFGMIEHTGIYVGDGYVIEQHGDDTLKKATLQEFIDGGGEFYARGLNINIQIACDSRGKPLAKKKVAKQALKLYNDYERREKEYSIVFNNCHQFCWECIAPKSNERLVMFSSLEESMAKHYEYVLYWDQVKI
jgi:cell wall-associated NlpC family hydrolase